MAATVSTYEEYTAKLMTRVRPFYKDGKELRTVSKLIKIEKIPGIVQLGCLVENESFQNIRVAFFLKMNDSQAVQFRRHYPEFSNVYNKGRNNWVVIIDWSQYAHLRWG